jgi:hypothetical protein
MQDIDDNYSPMRVGELEVIAVDFAPAQCLAVGETINAATWSITRVDGSAAPAGMLVNPQSIAGTVCSVYVRGVERGSFAPLCTATTSRGQTLTLPDPGRGLLSVV